MRRQDRKQVSNDDKFSESSLESDDSLATTSSEYEEAVHQPHVNSRARSRSEPLGIFTEIPSPERPFLRPPSATAKELMEIYKNYRRGGLYFFRRTWMRICRELDHSDPSKRPRYLPLAPPYHLLPNTSFFRKTAIKPPPTYCSDGLPPLKRIINRYLASILVSEQLSFSYLFARHSHLIDHMKLNEELRIFMQERRRHIQREHQAREGEQKAVDETEEGGEKAPREGQSLSLHNRQKRKPRVVIQHLLYGGQLIHYIQDGNDPPPIPGYFTNAPLIPSNVRINSLFLLGNQLMSLEKIPSLPCPEATTPSLVMSPQAVSPPQSTAASDVDEANDDAAEATPDFSVVATERYASISITSNVLNLNFR
ncbi:hypothetical protein OSTOST_09613 [Ostertagia ostertagi]